MAKPLKEKGVEELQAFLQRVVRQYGLRRISAEDFLILQEGTQQLITKVQTMDECDDMKGDN